jgi:hypothetical protein
MAVTVVATARPVCASKIVAKKPVKVFSQQQKVRSWAACNLRHCVGGPLGTTAGMPTCQLRREQVTQSITLLAVLSSRCVDGLMSMQLAIASAAATFATAIAPAAQAAQEIALTAEVRNHVYCTKAVSCRPGCCALCRAPLVEVSTRCEYLLLLSRNAPTDRHHQPPEI